MTKSSAFSTLHKVSLAAALSVTTLVALSPSELWSVTDHGEMTLSFNIADEIQKTFTADSSLSSSNGSEQSISAEIPKNTLLYTVQPGDNLSSIFEANGVGMTDLYNIMEEDTEYLSLATLLPGSELALKFDHQKQFHQLELKMDAARTITFSKQSDGSFQYQKMEKPTYWESEVLKGTIEGSFYNSALRAGLNKGQSALIGQLLENRLNFRRDLRAGDEFTVIVGHEMTGDAATHNTRLEAVSIKRGSQYHYAFRFDDGNYYDNKGNSVTPAFLRLPLAKTYRVSSHFNHNRLHPITGRRAPHNGVDFATPTGTPILSIGDGVVKRIGNHPYAGKYIDIDHGGSYTTRHLHLHRILVRKGSKVQRGQRIALSGNTGRSTGPHLHFELHFNGRPVNPLTAKIPTAAKVPKTELARFEQEVTQRLEVMQHAASRSTILLAQNEAGNTQS